MSYLLCIFDREKPLAVFNVLMIDNGLSILKELIQTRKLTVVDHLLPTDALGAQKLLEDTVTEMKTANPGVAVPVKTSSYLDMVNDLIANEMINKSKLTPALVKTLAALEEKRVKELANAIALGVR